MLAGVVLFFLVFSDNGISTSKLQFPLFYLRCNNRHHRNLKAIKDFTDPRSITSRTERPLLINGVDSYPFLTGVDESTLPPHFVEPNAHTTFESLMDQFVLDSERSNYLINVGAQDGKTHDPTYPLLFAGYDGILFEGDEGVKEQLYKNIAALPHYEIIKPYISWGNVSPHTVIARLAKGRARKDADVLKMDIDSFDAQLMETILGGGYRPKIIMVEFNPDLPPPMAWHQLYSPHPFNFDKVMLGNYGATASAWHNILTDKFGYGLVGMEIVDTSAKCERCEHNMWFVSKELLNRRGFRAMTHAEMTKIFWDTHSKAKEETGRMICIHAKNPCLLFTPNELMNAMPNSEYWHGDIPQRNLQLSLMLAEEPAISCEARKAYETSVVQSFLGQMEAGCRCKTCAEGDPCLQTWNIHTNSSYVC